MANQDYNKLFPNQRIDDNETECVGLTVSDLCGNIDGKIYDPDHVYANTLKLMNLGPTTAGSDPFTGMLEPIVYGLLPISESDFTAKTMGELYVANWQNYSAQDRNSAFKNTRNGVIPLYDYNSIVEYLSRNIGGVSLALRWYESFNTPNQDGTLPSPLGSYSYHNVAVYDVTEKGLLIKPWLGSTFGNGGYVYITETNFNLVELGGWAFDPSAWRWFSLGKIAVTHIWAINDILPLMKATQQPPTPHIQPVQPPVISTPTIPSFSPKIIQWAQIIGIEEGAKPELNNPGNLKYSTLTASWGASEGFQAADGGYIAAFPTLETGTKALCNFLVLACEDELIAFHQARTLVDFTKVYAGNPPQGYTDAIVNAMSGNPNVDISTFLT